MKYSSIVFAGFMAAFAITAMGQDKVVSPATASTASSVSAASPGPTIGLHERNPRYQLRKGDTFDLDLAYSPEFNQIVAVQPDGYVTLKGVGSIFVEGQTVPELTDRKRVGPSK